jgi:hypothetical protein
MDDLHAFGGGSAASWDELGSAFEGTSAGQAGLGSLSAFFDGGTESPPLQLSPETESATIFIDQCLKVSCPTALCAVPKCRRQTDKYRRGQCVVCDSCPKHVHTYLRCVQCQKTIHVGCEDGDCTRLSWTGNWKCSSCIKVVVQGAVADVPHVGASAGVGASACAGHAATAANSDEQELEDAAVEQAIDAADADSALDEKFICPPAWRSFIEAALKGTAHSVPMPTSKPTPTLLVDGGTAFDLYARRFNLDKKECKLHLDSHNHVAVEPLK